MIYLFSAWRIYMQIGPLADRAAYGSAMRPKSEGLLASRIEDSRSEVERRCGTD